jgi:hypothetical protein
MSDITENVTVDNESLELLAQEFRHFSNSLKTAIYEYKSLSEEFTSLEHKMRSEFAQTILDYNGDRKISADFLSSMDMEDYIPNYSWTLSVDFRLDRHANSPFYANTHDEIIHWLKWNARVEVIDDNVSLAFPNDGSMMWKRVYSYAGFDTTGNTNNEYWMMIFDVTARGDVDFRHDNWQNFMNFTFTSNESFIYYISVVLSTCNK